MGYGMSGLFNTKPSIADQNNDEIVNWAALFVDLSKLNIVSIERYEEAFSRILRPITIISYIDTDDNVSEQSYRCSLRAHNDLIYRYEKLLKDNKQKLGHDEPTL